MTSCVNIRKNQQAPPEVDEAGISIIMDTTEFEKGFLHTTLNAMTRGSLIRLSWMISVL
jgi:hypothetical protein